MRKFLILSWLLVSPLVLAATSYAVESDVDRLLDLLVEKKVLTKEDATGFRGELAVKKQEEKETQKDFFVIAGKPIKISGYTQLRYRHADDIKDTFDIRRARLNIAGDITERFDYRFQGEFGGNKGPFLLDATIGYKFNPHLKFLGGQFKIPFSQENLISSPKLETINRSQVVEALVARGTDVIGNQNGRDIGLQISGDFWRAGDRYLFGYAAGIFNGAGINTLDNNSQKDFIGRLVYHPLKDLSLGTSYYNGRYRVRTSPALNGERDRYGFEFAYTHAPVSLKGEYIFGIDNATRKDGWYLQAGYFVIPNKLQGVFKYDTFDPNIKVKNNETNVYTFGANWYFNKYAFLQVNYELKDEEGVEIQNNVLTGQLTLQF